MPPRTDCPSPETLALLSDGLLDERVRVQLTTHFDGCLDCTMMMVAIGESHVEDEEEVVDTGGAWLVAGDRIGRYVVREWLGRGGMGQVYVAADPQLGREVAIKLVGATADDRAQRRLLREAQAMAKLAHHNVVRVYDAGIANNGRAFIAMERVHGLSLDMWTAEHKPSWQTLVSIYVRAGRGLHAAHQAGVLHRDFKPSNVFVRDDGQVLVADFGLARLFGDRADLISAATIPFQLSQPTTNLGIAGTPGYIAPETLTGKATEKSDQFSFAVSLENSLRKATQGLGPKRVERIVKRARASHPANRFPSMEVLLSKLDGARRPRWPKVAAAGAVLAIAVISTAYFAFRTPPTLVELCGDPDIEGGQVWNPIKEQQVAAWFATSPHPFAAEFKEKFIEATQKLVGDYSTRFREICAATHREHSQTPNLLALRHRCLANRLANLDELLEQTISTEPGQATVSAEDALFYIQGVAPMTSCDPNSVMANATPEPSKEVAQAVTQLSRQVRRAHALETLKRIHQATQVLNDIEEQVLATHYAPLIAEFYAASASSEFAAKHHEQARNDAWSAMFAAQPLGIAGATARAAVVLSRLATNIEQTRRWLRLARHTAERIGPTSRELANLLADEAEIEFELGAFDAAWVANQRGRELAVKLYGEHSTPVLIHDVGIAAVLGSKGEPTRAIPILETALSGFTQTLGFHHWMTAQTRSNLGAAYAGVGDHEQAIRLYRETIASMTVMFGQDSSPVIDAETLLANSLSRDGKLAEATALFATLSKRAGLSAEKRLTLAIYVGSHLVVQKFYAQALATLNKAIDTYSNAVPDSQFHLNFGRALVGQILLLQKRPKQALVPLQLAYQHLNKSLARNSVELSEIRRDLAIAKVLVGNREQGVELFKKLIKFARAIEDRSARAEALGGLASALASVKLFTQARRLADDALDLLDDVPENSEIRAQLRVLSRSDSFGLETQ